MSYVCPICGEMLTDPDVEEFDRGVVLRYECYECQASKVLTFDDNNGVEENFDSEGNEIDEDENE